ncbi:MAG: flagellar hook assembly protein FlgD [Hyphomicrobiales bacterium]|nr:flagellar hook assembly protein FlgD [Rhodoblastus sp.]MCC2111698.1 flagellar hook assembly protein FlgD [Hyphomicrobiales bacterium]
MMAGAQTATPNVGSSSRSTLGYNDFLQLLMTQMKHQDPTSPTDSTQWVSQLATFSSVEQAVQTNSKLDQILQNTALTDAEALIGRSLISADGSVSGVVVAVSIYSDGLVATLDNGVRLPITSDVTISA